MSSLQILISGAGIAGPAVAFWLSRLGHSCTIVERCSKFRGEGQQVDLRSHGITVVERMGLREEMLKHNVDEMGLRIVNVRGETQILVPRQEQGEKTKVFTSEMEIMRTDLCRILYEATKDKVAYRFGVTVEDYDNEGDGVRVRLSDSETTERFDLLIAADGGHSRIREMMLRKDGSIRDSSVPLGVFIAYFKLARRAEDENMATGCCATKQRRMMTRWHGRDVGQAYLMTKSGAATIRASLETGGSGGKEGQKRQKEAFAGVFDGAGWQAERIVEAMHRADDFYAEEIVQRRSSGWHSGRVVLLGDACFAPGAVTGMGTTLALVGAYVLAGELAESSAEGKLGEASTEGKARGVEAGLEMYERRMRPYAEAGHVVPLGMWSPTWARTAAGVRVVIVVLKMAMWMRVGRVLAWLESKRGWEMPEYRGLRDECEEEE